MIGDRPVFEFNITSAGKNISDFGNGSVTVSVPYTLAAGEKPNQVVIHYITGDSTLEIVKQCKYDEATGMATFVAKHFSKYGIGHTDVSFKDIPNNAWYLADVGFVVARSLFSGISDTSFAPQQTMTRGMLVTVLGRLHGAKTDGSSSFADVDTKAYYAPYIAWAYDNKLVSGTGNGKFEPDTPVTREQLAAIVAKYADYAGYKLGSSSTAESFKDQSDISDWAVSAINQLKNANIYTGLPEGIFAPKASVTRAQVANAISRFLNYIIQ